MIFGLSWCRNLAKCLISFKAGSLKQVLKLVLPKGSLEEATLELFAEADLPVRRSSSVDYQASVDDPRIESVKILRPQEIPRYVAEGLFDCGITGRDWVEETSSDVVAVGELAYSKRSGLPIRVVLAVPNDSKFSQVSDLPQGLKVSTEYPEITSRFFESHGIEADVQLSYGATEAKVPDIVDCVVDIIETGRALRAAGLKVIATILTSYTEFIANPKTSQDPKKLHALKQIYLLLSGVLEARGHALLKMNVPADKLQDVIDLLPAMKSPTVNELFGQGGFAVESVVPKTHINLLIPALTDAGARDIVELSVAKIVH